MIRPFTCHGWHGWNGWQAWPPIGTILPYAGPLDSSEASQGGLPVDTNRVQDELAMTGWLPCDGRSLLIREYFPLFGVIGFAFGSADGQHFNLPDLRGRFVRGVGGHSTVDPDANARGTSAPGGNSGNKVGSLQKDTFQGHQHHFEQAQGPAALAQEGGAPGPLTTTTIATTNDLVEMADDGTPRSSSETRPVNLYLNHLIRFR